MSAHKDFNTLFQIVFHKSVTVRMFVVKNSIYSASFFSVVHVPEDAVFQGLSFGIKRILGGSCLDIFSW